MASTSNQEWQRFNRQLNLLGQELSQARQQGNQQAVANLSTELLNEMYKCFCDRLSQEDVPVICFGKAYHVDVFQDAVFAAVEQYDHTNERGASFITFFRMQLKYKQLDRAAADRETERYNFYYEGSAKDDEDSAGQLDWLLLQQGAVDQPESRDVLSIMLARSSLLHELERLYRSVKGQKLSAGRTQWFSLFYTQETAELIRNEYSDSWEDPVREAAILQPMIWDFISFIMRWPEGDQTFRAVYYAEIPEAKQVYYHFYKTGAPALTAAGMDESHQQCRIQHKALADYRQVSEAAVVQQQKQYRGYVEAVLPELLF